MGCGCTYYHMESYMVYMESSLSSLSCMHSAMRVALGCCQAPLLGSPGRFAVQTVAHRPQRCCAGRWVDAVPNIHCGLYGYDAKVWGNQPVPWGACALHPSRHCIACVACWVPRWGLGDLSYPPLLLQTEPCRTLQGRTWLLRAPSFRQEQSSRFTGSAWMAAAAAHCWALKGRLQLLVMATHSLCLRP